MFICCHYFLRYFVIFLSGSGSVQIVYVCFVVRDLTMKGGIGIPLIGLTCIPCPEPRPGFQKTYYVAVFFVCNGLRREVVVRLLILVHMSCIDLCTCHILIKQALESGYIQHYTHKG
jgi:hypothetical protein